MDAFTEQLAATYDQFLSSTVFREFSEDSGFWNYGYWLPATRTHREACDNMMERLLYFFPSKQGRILDVACGRGATSRYLTRHFAPTDIIGINISEKQLELCRAAVPNAEFLLMDATRLHFPDASFDHVLCVEAAFHFNTREAFLHEAYRVLKPGGRLVLSDEVLAPGMTSVQPLANLVDDWIIYKQRCFAVGFDDVMVVDATYECWDRFCAELNRYIEQKYHNGEASWQQVTRTRGWMTMMDTQLYMLVMCRKPA